MKSKSTQRTRLRSESELVEDEELRRVKRRNAMRKKSLLFASVLIIFLTPLTLRAQDYVLKSGDTVNGALNVMGRMGVGTTEPIYELHVDTRAQGYIGIEYDTNWYAGIAFLENGVPSGYVQMNDSATPDRLEFLVGGGSGSDRKMVIEDTGNIGIGTITPEALLHVAGDVQIDGNIAAKFQ